MRLLRGIGGALLWVVALVLTLVAVILCATLILLPVGLPLLGYARRLFTFSLRLMFPRAAAGSAKAVQRAAHPRGAGKANSDARA